MKTCRFIGLILAFAAICPFSQAASAPAPTVLIANLERLFPGSDPKLVEDASLLPGFYQTNFLGAFEVYLFPDQTYGTIDIHHYLILEQGTWYLENGMVRLTKPESGRVKSSTRTLTAVALTQNGKRQLFMTNGDPTEAGVRLLSDGFADRKNAFFLMDISYTKYRNFSASETPALKIRFVDDRGKYGYEILDKKFGAKFAQSAKLADGTFVLTGKGTLNEGIADLAIPRDLKGTIRDYAEEFSQITIAGVLVRAQRIEINHEMTVVKVSGSVEVVGGKFPQAPGVTIFVEGKQVQPPLGP